MAKVIDTIIQSLEAPQQTNVLWDNGSTIFRWLDEKWQPLIGSGQSYRPYIAYSNSADGTKDFTTEKPTDLNYEYLGIAVNSNIEIPAKPSEYEWNKVVGSRGLKGDQGPKGDKGEKGEDGKPGLDAISFKNIVAFITYEPTLEKPNPDTPIGGFWDVENDIITLPEGWTNTDTIPAPVWMSNGTFSSLNPDNPTWTTPQRISGEKGNNGADGVNQEFIYCLTKNQNIQPPVITNSNTDDHIPAGWSDSPKGIDEYNQVEWYASRKKDSLGNWLDFEGPFIWSKWGVNGLDGDGVQYIFRRNNGEALKNPIEEFNIDITSDEYQEKGDYKDVEYKPTDWSDNPQGVNPTYTHEWCCKRKFRNGVWGEYSDPALWAKYGEDGYNGISIKTRYAVTDNSTEVPPINKTDKNPGSIWGSVIPHYESPQALWETQAYVDYKGDLVEVVDDDETIIYGWCDPILKSGVAGEKGAVPNYKSTYFCKADSIPNKPTYKTLSEVESSSIWLDYPNDAGQWWQSTAVIDGTTEEIISWGTVLQVNGQDGIAQDGKYWETRFATSSNDSAPELNKYKRDPSTDTVTWVKIDATTPPPTIPEGGSLWQIWAEIQPGGTSLVDGWSDPYRVNGERGPRGYQGATGEPGAQGPSGIHGVDFEVLYCLGTEDSYSASNAPSGNLYTGWTWVAPEVTETYKYIWCCQGKKIYNNSAGTSYTYDWGKPFRLSGINGLGKDGVGIKDVKNYYAVSDSSTKAPTDWGNEGEIPQLSENLPYLWNYEVIEYTNNTEKRTSPQVKSIVGANGRSISEIIEYYYVGPEADGITIDSVEWKTEPLYPNDVDIYLWNYEEIVFDKGNPIKTDPVRIGNYSKGEKGSVGKTIYPAGIYDPNTSYQCSETSCPYVLDSSDGNYYLLNADKWESGQTLTPHQSFLEHPYKYWSKMDFYEAIFAKVGIIANGLFGSAVFNGDYMFSQQGTTTINGTVSGDYNNFNPEDPFGNNNSFYPNVCINFKTGETWLGKSKLTLENGLIENTLGKIFKYIDCSDWNITHQFNIESDILQNNEIIIILTGNKNEAYSNIAANISIKYKNGNNLPQNILNKIKLINRSTVRTYIDFYIDGTQKAIRYADYGIDTDLNVVFKTQNGTATELEYYTPHETTKYTRESIDISPFIKTIIYEKLNNTNITLTLEQYSGYNDEINYRTIILHANMGNTDTITIKPPLGDNKTLTGRGIYIIQVLPYGSISVAKLNEL